MPPAQSFFESALSLFILTQQHKFMQEGKSQTEVIRIFEDGLTNQVAQIRCRICYSNEKPLITICQCSDLKQYMHTQCATNWIGKKIEQTQSLAIPKCQICFKYFNAELLMKERMISCMVLLKNLKKLTLIQLAKSILYLLGSIVAISVLIAVFINQATGLMNYLGANLKIESGVSWNFSSLFIELVFPLVYLKFALKNFKKRRQFWQNSKIQVIELTLHPVAILNQ